MALQEQHFNFDFPNSKVLVVGGNGYFGFKLVEALLKQGCKSVRVLDRIQTRFMENPRVDFMCGDICDVESCTKACEGMDIVCHTASHFGNPPFGSLGKGEIEFKVNVLGTRTLLTAAKRAGIKKFIYISSSSAVFNGTRDFVQEKDDCGYPDYFVDHYGRCKAIAEQEVLAANDPKNSFFTIALRPNGIYGEDEMIHIPRVRNLCRFMANTLFIHFGERATCDWTFVDNLIFACFLSMEKLNAKSPASGRVYNITDGEVVGVIDFFGPSLEATGVTIYPCIFIPFFVVYFFACLIEVLAAGFKYAGISIKVPCTRIEAIKICKTHSFSIEQAKKDLDYYPIVSTKEGMTRAGADFAFRSKNSKYLK